MKIGKSAVILIALLLIGCTSDIPRAHNGVLDLREYRFNSAAPVPLNGEWYIHWNRLIPADSISRGLVSGAEITSVPAPWMKTRKGAVFGSATYHLKVLLSSAETSKLHLLCKEQPSAYALWVNGKRVMGSGEPASDKESEKPSFVTSFGSIDAADTLDLVLQISNHHIDAGGFTTPILLGSAPRITSWFSTMVLLQLVCFGIMIYVFLQYSSAWLHRSGRKEHLYLALYSLLWAAAVFMESAEFRMVTFIFPEFPFELSNKIYFTALGLSFPLTCLFCERLFPSPLLKLCNPPLAALAGAYSLVILFTDASFYSRLFPVFVTISDLCIIAVVHALASAVRKKRREAALFAVGFAAFSLAGLNDSLYNSAVIQSHFLCTYGAAALLLVEAVLVSRRYAETSAANVRLLADLQEKTVQVESYIAQFAASDSVPIGEIGAHVTALKASFENESAVYAQTVSLMKETLGLWSRMTGLAKADFAESSGLWSVHADKNGWRRTLTLDKYLDIEKIPENPRWQIVYRSVLFVLDHPSSAQFPAESAQLKKKAEELLIRVEKE